MSSKSSSGSPSTSLFSVGLLKNRGLFGISEESGCFGMNFSYAPLYEKADFGASEDPVRSFMISRFSDKLSVKFNFSTETPILLSKEAHFSVNSECVVDVFERAEDCPGVLDIGYDPTYAASSSKIDDFHTMGSINERASSIAAKRLFGFFLFISFNRIGMSFGFIFPAIRNFQYAFATLEINDIR